MKKHIACILAAGMLLGLVGCTDASSSNQGESAESSQASVSMPVEEAPAPPESAPPAEPAPAELDKAALEAFIEGSGIGIFAGGDIPAGQSINEILGEWGLYGMVTWTLDYAYTAQQLEKLEVWDGEFYAYPIEELEKTADELFGGRCDFAAWVDGREGLRFDETPDGYLQKMWGFGPTYWGEPDWDTLTYEGGVAEITLAYDSQHGTYWLTRFAFAPRPGNAWSPFELLWAEVLFTQELIEPDVRFEETQYYITTENLNLRRGPGTEYEPPMLTIPAGTEIHVAGKMSEGYEDWVYIDSGMSGGWVNTRYIEKARP